VAAHPVDPKDIFASKGICRVELEGQARYAFLENGELRLYKGNVFSGAELSDIRLDPAEAAFLAPTEPSKVVAVGLNYKAHAREMGHALPEEPLIFLKPSTTVIGPGQAVVRPENATRVDYEAELGIVIASTCSRVEPPQALEYVLGYTCLNDVTERDLQARDGQFTRGKGFDTFCPLGPVITKEIDPGEVYLRGLVDNEIRQDSHTSDLIFSIPEIVSFISKVMTLLPGDVIATGTPAGVGPVFAGQEMTIEVGGVGRLKNPVVDA
jgi:2-keto-4-pentenoate hydratase/2-oxohepta-3-ene-1,7-dioic acid hydratase in catechol pathway